MSSRLHFPEHPLVFLIPQGQREVSVRIIPGSEVKTPSGRKKKNKPWVYQDGDWWVLQRARTPLFALAFASEADLRLASQVLRVVFHEAEIYGYVRMDNAETEVFLAHQTVTVEAYADHPGIPSGELLTFSTGHVLLRHPHLDTRSHGTLFMDAHALSLEERAMEGFMKYIDANP